MTLTLDLKWQHKLHMQLETVQLIYTFTLSICEQQLLQEQEQL